MAFIIGLPSDEISGLRLEPESGIDHAGGQTLATSSEPWFQIKPVDWLSRRRWIRLRYSSSFFDDPVRPLIRFASADGRVFLQPMNGPVLGCGEWIGRVPERTIAVSISPVKCSGRFDFRRDFIKPVSRQTLIQRGLSYDRKSLLLSLGAKFINANEERWETLKFASSATPLENYDQWHRRLERRLDVDGLDRPRTAWNSNPTIQLVVELSAAGIEQLNTTLSSLRAQAYRRWSLHGVETEATSASLLTAFCEAAAADSRLHIIESNTPLTASAAQDCVAVIKLGDLIPDYAFAVLAERFAGAPDIQIIYGDEDSVSANGKLHSPVFRPDWSPIFYNGSPYLGQLTAVRYRCVSESGLMTAAELIRDEGSVLARLVTSVAPTKVAHIRRILYRRRREPEQTIVPVAETAAPPVAAGAYALLPEVTIVIPTRDRAKLLAGCMKTLRAITDYPGFEVIVVDNGSTTPGALGLLKQLGKQARTNVLSRPGKFNFSALCNAGARLARTPLLVFLNNDVVIFDPAWLRALVCWASQPGIGVVGAKLLLPNGMIEHAGAVLGLGGIAGQIYEGQPGSEPGHLQELRVTHEVSAVTGACIAIQRGKFEAIGGFDSDNLPVELNDTDLCLRAAARGWKTLWTPESVAYHLQSATRGFQVKPAKRYQKERDYFQKRWANVIRDDPFFHPALSLFSRRPALA